MGADGRVESEEDLIQTYFAPLAADFPGAYGLRDDCATLSLAPGEELVVTTDAVAAGVHFLDDDNAADVAWKALAVNVSDLAAKGARPVAYFMALAFPEAPQTEWLASFAKGLGAAQARFGIALAGGDTDRRPGPVAINITAMGVVPAAGMVQRCTAKPGDALYVSGTLGDAALGLKLRRNRLLAEVWGLDSLDVAALVARYLRPEPRIGLRQALLGYASAALDISDGLAKDAKHLAKASSLRAVVHGNLLPLSPNFRHALSAHPDLFLDAVAWGDDYEVLASVPDANCKDYEAAARAAGVAVAKIGEMTAGDGVTITNRDGRALNVSAPGWEHFRSRHASEHRPPSRAD